MTSYDTLREFICAKNNCPTFAVELIDKDGHIRTEQVRSVVFPSKIHNPIYITEGQYNAAQGQSLALVIDCEPVSDYMSSFVVYHQCSNSMTVEARPEPKDDQAAD